MDELIKAIVSKLSGSALSTDVNGRVYLDRAPDSCEFPYIVFFVVSSVPDWMFTERFEDTMIQFSLFSNSESAVEITTMLKDLKSLFDDCSLTITSDTLVWFRRQNIATMVEDITTTAGAQAVKHYAVDYEAKVQTD
ncbi:MAG: hypothetical protein CVU71_03660 [Deltaproteobacteria bacterium HGW-Deltaproteobacteria-6]|jgi:hypothetical protein|nr:MAG: hypothetical protein CVU71_03660 [Deltaproteobacteria bacterium HGW-Deltaproteobacteria-6]